MAKPTEVETAQYKEAFNLFDKNRDGFITKEELSTCVHYFGMDYCDEELDKHITHYDQDGNRRIDFREYMAVVSDKSHQKAPDKEEIIAAFKMFDTNKDGFVNAKELSDAMKTLGNKMSPAEIKQMLDAADFNCDGRIDYSEFTTMMFS